MRLKAARAETGEELPVILVPLLMLRRSALGEPRMDQVLAGTATPWATALVAHMWLRRRAHADAFRDRILRAGVPDHEARLDRSCLGIDCQGFTFATYELRPDWCSSVAMPSP